MDFRGITYTGLATEVEFGPGSAKGFVEIDNTAITADLAGEFTRLPDDNVIALEGSLRCPDMGIFAPYLQRLGIESDIDIDLAGHDYNTMEGGGKAVIGKGHAAQRQNPGT